MSQTFTNITSFPYLGNVAGISAQPIKIKNLSGQSVPLVIPWALYSTSTFNIGVQVNLGGQGLQNSLQQIRSVYIDNMKSSCPVYILFPDTGYVVVAKENSAGWFPVYTNQYNFSIIALGIDPNNIPITKVLITNVAIDASVDVEIDSAIAQFLASSLIQRGGTFNPQIGVPALGDQLFSTSLNSAINGAVSTLWGTPLAVGEFVYVTSVFCTVNMFAANTTIQAIIESTGLSGPIFNQVISVPAGSVLINSPFLNLQAQWKLDASQTWRVRSQVLGGAPQGQINFSFSYTINP